MFVFSEGNQGREFAESQVRKPFNRAAIMDYCDALNEPGLLYIIQEGQSDYYKVGVTKNQDTLKSRLQNLQSGNWRKLTIKQASKVSNMNSAEQYAHDQLKALQVKAGGGQEWFRQLTIKGAVDDAVKKYPPK